MTTILFRDWLSEQLGDSELAVAYAAECQHWQRNLPRRFAWLALARTVDPRHAAACERVDAEPVSVDKSDYVAWGTA